MKEVLVDLANYHYWANKRLIEKILNLPSDVPPKEVSSSFPSLFKTFEHLFWSEQVWMQRLQTEEKAAVIRKKFHGTFDELAEKLLEHNSKMTEWIRDLNESYLKQVVAYYNSEKKYFKMPMYQCLLHVFNHGTYHRGQVVTMLRELGIERIPATDYIAFRREPSQTPPKTESLEN